MSPLICTDMKPEDVRQAAALEKEAFSHPWTEENFLDSLQLEDTIFLVAKEQDELVGYCGCYQSMDEGSITNVVVKASVRRKGVASALLVALLEEGRLRGIKSFFLEVRVSNDAAIALYKKMGFLVAGRRRNFYTAPVEDAWVMVCETEE